MNKTFIYLFLPLLLLTVSCVKSSQPTNVVLPSGTFSGPFTRIHRSTITGKLDTVKANLIITMSAATGFSVTGDTSTVHAGSYGSYIVNGSIAQFVDLTFPTNTTTPPVKTHLSGIYQYQYDGTNLLIFGSNDTLGVSYQLKAN